MADLQQADHWHDGIYQLEEDDNVLGGPAGISNLASRQLGDRSLYQRLRGVTPWDRRLAYPAQVCYVSHGGQTWRSVEASTGSEPGANPRKWQRWGYTDDELRAALSSGIDAHASKDDPHTIYAHRDGFATVPKDYRGQVITVTEPHLRHMVWNGAAYVRAPWHQPGMVLYSYDNPPSIPGYLPVQAGVIYSQASYPDLVERLGLSGVGTFVLIELRGEFIRCLDNGRGVDAGRSLRGFQKATIVGGYDDNADARNVSYLANKGGVDYGSDPVQPTLYPGWQAYYTCDDPAPQNAAFATSFFSATRPRNVALPVWVSY